MKGYRMNWITVCLLVSLASNTFCAMEKAQSKPVTAEQYRAMIDQYARLHGLDFFTLDYSIRDESTRKTVSEGFSVTKKLSMIEMNIQHKMAQIEQGIDFMTDYIIGHHPFCNLKTWFNVGGWPNVKHIDDKSSLELAVKRGNIEALKVLLADPRVSLNDDAINERIFSRFLANNNQGKNFTTINAYIFHLLQGMLQLSARTDGQQFDERLVACGYGLDKKIADELSKAIATDLQKIKEDRKIAGLSSVKKQAISAHASTNATGGSAGSPAISAESLQVAQAQSVQPSSFTAQIAALPANQKAPKGSTKQTTTPEYVLISLSTAAAAGTSHN